MSKFKKGDLVKVKKTGEILIVKWSDEYDIECILPDGSASAIFRLGQVEEYNGDMSEIDMDDSIEYLPGDRIPIKESSGSKALRYNEGKPKWSLVDFKSLEPMVRVLEYGVDKYTIRDEDGNITRDGRDQWKEGHDLQEILDSAMRHLIAIIDGEEFDHESGLDHMGHLMCNAMFYIYNKNNLKFKKSKSNE